MKSNFTKNKLKALSLIVILSIIASCSKEQALINKIEGTYKIEKVVSIVNGGESVVTYTNSTMFFSECKLKDQTPQQCAGYYEVEGQSRITFDYLPDKDGGKEIMRINIGDMRLEPYFGGNYIIEDRDDNGFTLARYDFDKNFDKVYDLRIFLKR
ncbi:MAG TPA: hypothetical protein VLZ28_00325 [Daejeonella sp.]|nr:hypothetical protein [Daejeonella sp.]